MAKKILKQPRDILKLKYLPKETACRDCGDYLTTLNQYPSCIKQRQFYCKKCWNEKFYHAVRKKKYGLTKEEYERMQTEQDNKCLICETEIKGKDICVDHCHDTGDVRGLLCRTCNSGLGFFKDTLEILENAVTYMQNRRRQEKADA
jgi:hypothetical protein